MATGNLTQFPIPYTTDIPASAVVGFKGTLSGNTVDMDTLYRLDDSGIYYLANNVLNAPATFAMVIIIGTNNTSTSISIQVVLHSSYIYIRRRVGSGDTYNWEAWKRVALSAFS